MDSLSLLGSAPVVDRFALTFHCDRPYPGIIVEGHGYSKLEVRIQFSEDTLAYRENA